MPEETTTLSESVRGIESYHYLSFPVMDYSDCTVIHAHCFAAAVSHKKRHPVWVAYCVELGNLLGDVVLHRNFHRDHEASLKPGDFENTGWDLGHAAPLSSYRANRWAGETNDMSNVFIQSPELNRGPWLRVEKIVRKRARLHDRVWVVAIPLWRKNVGKLAGVRVPSHCAKLIAWYDDTELRHESYCFPQEIDRSDPIDNYRCSFSELKRWSRIEPFVVPI